MKFIDKFLKTSNCQRIMSLAVKFCWGMILFSALSIVSPVLAQFPRPDAVAVQVYQKIPDFPLENQYISQDTGKIVANNTLLSRFIRYHQYIKNRPLIYRLDWQLTLADYLQVNEIMLENRYPGNNSLTTNPLQNDRTAIASLTRSQRNQLIETLLTVYNPTLFSVPQTPSPTPPNPTRPRLDDSLPLPQPGDAQLLLP